MIVSGSVIGTQREPSDLIDSGRQKLGWGRKHWLEFVGQNVGDTCTANTVSPKIVVILVSAAGKKKIVKGFKIETEGVKLS